MIARVTTAAQAARRDQAAIDAGTPSFELMLRAGSAAAEVILREYSHRLSGGVALFAGGGNNGGDAWVIAAQLARAGVLVRLCSAYPPGTDDSRRAAALASPHLVYGAPLGNEDIVVDGLLGTGFRGAIRDAVVNACGLLSRAKQNGALVVALDVPSGLDATNGKIAPQSVAADVTLCFGSVKRGVLIQRGHAGRIITLDIGLDSGPVVDDEAWILADERMLVQKMPSIAWNAHKGTRGKLAIVGGAEGMAGAVVLSGRSALGSGVGLTELHVEGDSLKVVQQAVPQAIARPWSEGEWSTVVDALAIGPGLGRGAASRAIITRALASNDGAPVVLDADALTLAASEASSGKSTSTHGSSAQVIRGWVEGREQVVCTPHPGEFARLIGRDVPEDWEQKALLLSNFATEASTTVLLKGTPTLIASPDQTPPLVLAFGTALLATGGSGDLLTGIIGALLASGASAKDAAMLGAAAHGIAAEIATAEANAIRGLSLESILDALPHAWKRISRNCILPPHVLGEFPSPVT